MGFEAVQLFGNVDTLRHQHQLLLETVILQLHFSIFQLGDQTLALPLENFRHMGANFRHFAAHAFKTLLDKRFQRLAFRFASDDEVIQRAVKGCQNIGGDGVKILFFGGHHARPAQDINRIDFPFITLHFYPVGGVNQLFSQLFVENQFALSAGVLFKTQGAFDFTASQAGANALAYHGLQATELLRQAEVRFQIALVYRAQLPCGATPVTLDFTAGIGGHTADHRRSCFRNNECKDYSYAGGDLTGIVMKYFKTDFLRDIASLYLMRLLCLVKCILL